MSRQSKPIKNLCVFCGSGRGQNPNFKRAAKDLGRALGKHKIKLIFGGGNMGLMGALAAGAVEKGGDITGIIPEFLLKYQSTDQPAISQEHLIITKTMHERKAKMYELADGFIALPGGIGTLEELVETMTWEQLGQHTKPIFLLNIDNFWAPFLTLLSQMQEEQFIRGGLEVNINVVDTISDIFKNITTPEAV